MMIRRTFTPIAVLLALVVGGTLYAGDDKAPHWLSSAAGQKAPEYEKDVPAVVLLDDESVTLEGSGNLKIVRRYAIRILTKEGRGLASASIYYLASTEKVSDFEAWTIDSRGRVTEYSKKQILDIISDPDDVYNEGRLKVIDASDDVDAGFVFGYSVTSEYRPLFFQDVYQFQSRLPTLQSRYTLNLPEGWSAESVTFNHADIEPRVNGSTYSWELGGLPPIPPEPMSPSVTNLVPFIAVNFKPAEGGATANRVFDSWNDVSLWATEMYDQKVVLNDEIALKARELTEGLETEIEKIRAVGNYVQNLQYISIDIGVGHGNGYRPRASDLVLSRGYGDCKDKATLMRALLKALKIEAYPVVIYSGDPTFVKKEWASPRQFNHCIIAVKVGDDTHSHAIIEDPRLGRLLMFDSTDDLVPVGDLPSHLQGGHALIVAGEHGSLVQMPVLPPEVNGLSREVEVSLYSNGSIVGTIEETSMGESSRRERYLYRKASRDDYQKSIEGWLSIGATAARLVQMTPEDRFKESSFFLKVGFEAPTYGQVMQDRLLIFRPAIVGRSRSIYLTDKDRKTPVKLEPFEVREKAVFELPDGFTVDEVPDSVDLVTQFGGYSTSYRVEGGKLYYERRMQLKDAELPVESYSEIRDFFMKVLDAEQSVVVLVRD